MEGAWGGHWDWWFLGGPKMVRLKECGYLPSSSHSLTVGENLRAWAKSHKARLVKLEQGFSNWVLLTFGAGRRAALYAVGWLQSLTTPRPSGQTSTILTNKHISRYHQMSPHFLLRTAGRE